MNIWPLARAAFIGGALLGVTIDECDAQGEAQPAAASESEGALPGAAPTQGSAPTVASAPLIELQKVTSDAAQPTSAELPVTTAPTRIAPTPATPTSAAATPATATPATATPATATPATATPAAAPLATATPATATRKVGARSGVSPTLEQRFDLTYRSLPKSLPYDGGAPPEGYVLEHRTSKLLWIPGGATLLASWLYTAMAAGLVGKSHLAIPLAGPWIDLARGGDNREARRTDVLAGSLQAIGAGMLVAGLLVDEPRFVRADLAGVRVSPMIGAEMMGARLGAQF